jgi:hypothetical protein
MSANLGYVCNGFHGDSESDSECTAVPAAGVNTNHDIDVQHDCLEVPTQEAIDMLNAESEENSLKRDRLFQIRLKNNATRRKNKRLKFAKSNPNIKTRRFLRKQYDPSYNSSDNSDTSWTPGYGPPPTSTVQPPCGSAPAASSL